MDGPLPAVVAIAVLCNDDVIKTSAIFLRMKRQYWVETKSEIKKHTYLGFYPLCFRKKGRNSFNIEEAKRKQTKRVLRKIYYSPQSKESISLEVAVETKLFPDSAFGNSLCNSGYKTKSENPLFFSWPPMPLEIELPPPG